MFLEIDWMALVESLIVTGSDVIQRVEGKSLYFGQLREEDSSVVFVTCVTL